MGDTLRTLQVSNWNRARKGKILTTNLIVIGTKTYLMPWWDGYL